MKNELLMDRAWVEINLKNLEHNIIEIKKIIPAKTKIMAVVKANAYGHGMIEISHKLNKIGIFDFAVATLEEAISLRQNNIKGNILILGYTSVENLKYVVQYDLIQTIVDEEYANKIVNVKLNEKLKVHIKINTGMNRIGIHYSKIDFLKQIYDYDNIDVLGIFSHLCVSDSNKKNDIKFTNIQIKRFHNLIEELKTNNIDVGKVHLQSSYGVLNYPELEFDYVRIGIIMYGVHSDSKSYCKRNISLLPVLSLKARVSSVKEITKNETVSYGRKYKALKKEKVATVSIGYADGYPRNLSCKNVKVLVENKYAKIIGRICMDQLVINVSNIKNIKQGDIVTLIGNNNQVTAETIALKSQTITNELLSRLGNRLNYIFIDN